jgi:dephospho-CoA kinase
MADGLKPPIIGITGGIGAGKTAVANILRELGCVVADSDAMARAALQDPAIRSELVAWWGRTILREDGTVDRSRIASIVFADPHERKRLESLVHPWIELRRRALFDDAPPGAPALVIDAPLLVEAGLDEECDAVIYVDAPRSTRLKRLFDRSKWDEAELLRREESQLPLDEKRRRSDHVVVNTGDIAELARQVQLVLTRITQQSGDNRPAPRNREISGG